MVWAKLQLPNNKSLYLCSFYRPPNNNVTPITKLNDFLSSVFYNESPQLPQILLAGDFNLPSISWIDGQIKPNPTYGTDVNQSLLGSINEFALDQLVTESTRGRNILDLIFSFHPESISKIEVIPGISDHEAVYVNSYYITNLNLTILSIQYFYITGVTWHNLKLIFQIFKLTFFPQIPIPTTCMKTGRNLSRR